MLIYFLYRFSQKAVFSAPIPSPDPSKEKDPRPLLSERAEVFFLQHRQAGGILPRPCPGRNLLTRRRRVRDLRHPRRPWHPPPPCGRSPRRRVPRCRPFQEQRTLARQRGQRRRRVPQLDSSDRQGHPRRGGRGGVEQEKIKMNFYAARTTLIKRGKCKRIKRSRGGSCTFAGSF